MAISSVGSNARPGVCTSTTRPTSPYHGQVIFETDTNRTLVWDNSAWVMVTDADQPPGLQFITSRTFTASASENFDVFSSEFTHYQVNIRLSHRSASTNIHLRFRSGSTTNADNDYYYSAYYMDQGTATGARNGNPSTFIELFTVPNFPDFCQGTFTILSPALEVRTIVNGVHTNNIGAGFAHQQLGALKNVTTAWSGFQLYSSTGGTTFGAQVEVYGYRN